MPDAPISVSLDGAHLRIDARPARLVSMVRRAGDGDARPAFTAKRSDGASTTQAVPASARQVTFLVVDSLTVEATPGSDFVGLAESSGRRLVVAFNGEVTVLPSGPDGDRFALGAHEALLVPADGGEARLVPVDDLSDDEQDEISAVLESAALGVADGAAATVEKSPPVKATGAAKKRAKKGKRGRPQPQTRKNPPTTPVTKTTGAGVRKAAPVAGAKATTRKSTAVSNKAVATASHDESYQDTPRDRRFVIGALVLAAVIAIVLAVLFLTDDDSGSSTDVAANGSSTTAAPASTTSTAAPAATTTAAAAAPEDKHSIKPNSCEQTANNTITYTASITNEGTATFDYTIPISFKDGATEVATANATVTALAPGKTVDFSATGTPDRSLTGGGKCEPGEVTATPSP